MRGLIPCAPMPKIEQRPSTGSVTNPRTPALTRPTEVTAPTPAGGSKPVEVAFTSQAPVTRELAPRGSQVTASADPSSLWGAPATKPAPLYDREAFRKMSPDQQRSTLEKLKVERADRATEIQARIDRLDSKWKNSRLTTRTEALREYRHGSRELDPAAKAKLDVAIAKSDTAQAKIEQLKERAAKLPKDPASKAAMAAERKQLAAELRKARADQSKAVAAATATVDAEGLKVDRLAVTEQVIDPSAPTPGSGGSLLEKLADFLHLDSFFSWCTQWSRSIVSDAFARDMEKQREHHADSIQEEQQQRALQQRRQTEDLGAYLNSLSRRGEG